MSEAQWPDFTADFPTETTVDDVEWKNDEYGVATEVSGDGIARLRELNNTVRAD